MSATSPGGRRALLGSRPEAAANKEVGRRTEPERREGARAGEGARARVVVVVGSDDAGPVVAPRAGAAAAGRRPRASMPWYCCRIIARAVLRAAIEGEWVAAGAREQLVVGGSRLPTRGFSKLVEEEWLEACGAMKGTARETVGLRFVRARDRGGGGARG